MYLAVIHYEIDVAKEQVMLPKAAVVCVLLALFSAGSQGNKEANVDNHHLATGKERFLRFVGQPPVFRRDSGSGSGSRSEACLPDSPEYSRRMSLLHCDSEEYIQAVMSDLETSSCRLYFYETPQFFFGCGTNHNGDVCTGLKDSIHEDIYLPCNRELNCRNCDCSSGCQTALRQLSKRVGCCIYVNVHAITPLLWTNCNIEQPEVCADTPKIADIFVKRGHVDPCTKECSERQLFYQLCKHFGDRYEQLNRECGYENVIHQCQYDRGDFCYNYNLNVFFRTLSEECYSDNSSVSDGVCSTNCKNLVEELVDKIGCCIDVYSVSEILFSVCGIETPDACTSFNSTAVPDDYLECAGLTINSNGAVLNQSGVYTIGVIGLIAIYILII